MNIPKEALEAWKDLERCYIVHSHEKELCAGEFATYQKALLDAGLDESDMLRELTKMFEQTARLTYELARAEARVSGRSIVPEVWEERDQVFREQFINTCRRYILEGLPSPEEAHESWMRAYKKMGWKYGQMRDPEKRVHPDMVPFNKLPKDERDKDTIFLWLLELSYRIVCLSYQERLNEDNRFS